MRILVTGAAGFIGFHLAERLLAEGHTVVGLDNFASGQPANADALRQHSAFTFVEHDLIQPLTLKPEFDQIYNLACPASPADFDRIPLEIMAVCSDGVRNCLDLARAAGARLLHTSTSEVYGDPQEHPQRETYWGNVNPIGPRACYDEGKRFAEALLVSCAAQHGVTVRIARIFNTYGPRMRGDDGRALPNFINQALDNQPVTVHGDGSQTRSFCYVTDLVDGLVRLMNGDIVGPVNLGNPVEITMLEAAREVIALIGSTSTIENLPRPKDDPNLRRPDISRARRELGWSPQVDRAAGFARTVDWFRQMRS
ncbi:MAG: SDR family oxidoreductase [Phycisphaerae bacterium]|nr:SDR family oxidoreductase [Phycisphaerae bacterium]